MARILAVDWDGVEVRFVLGSIQKDRLVVSNVGSALIEYIVNENAAVDTDEVETDDFAVNSVIVSTESVDAEGEEEEIDDGVLETVEKSYIPRMPVADDEDEDEDEALVDPAVVSTVKKGRGESFKTSPIARTLKKLLRERRVGSAVLCYSAERGDVDVMYMTIPNASDTETPELIYNQALRDSLTFNENQPLDFMTLGLPETPKKTGFRRVAAVSIARDKLRRVRETLIGAYHAPAKIELREPSLAEFLRADFCSLRYDEPVLLIQELCDEVNLTLCYQKSVLYFRSFKVLADSNSQERVSRIHEEIVRTLAVGLDDLPEEAVVNRALFFTGSASTLDNPEAGMGDACSVASLLEALLLEDEIQLDRINPFRLSGIRLRTTEPKNPGRYASLLGMLLAERPKTRPSVDLLHPHEKPKPPNFTLFFLGYFMFVFIAALAAWFWNKEDLQRLNSELVALEKSRDEVLVLYNQTAPGFNVLRTVNSWQNQQGVVVLDELRDIIRRLPSSPAFVTTRLAYIASYSGNVQQLRNKPVFIISAKVTGIEVYQQFVRNMQLNNAHVVYSARGPVNNPGGDYKYMFEAFIICQRRPAQSFLAVLPQDIQQISSNRPEYHVEREEEQRRLLVEAQEKNFNDNVSLINKALDVVNNPPTSLIPEEGDAAFEQTEEELLRYGKQLEEASKELKNNYAVASRLATQNGLNQEQVHKLGNMFREANDKLTQKWNEVDVLVAQKKAEAIEKAILEKKEAIRKEVEAAAISPTSEKDENLRQRLLSYRSEIDQAANQKWIAFNNGQMTRDAFEKEKVEYQSEVAYVMESWNTLTTRIKVRNEQSEDEVSRLDGEESGASNDSPSSSEVPTIPIEEESTHEESSPPSAIPESTTTPEDSVSVPPVDVQSDTVASEASSEETPSDAQTNPPQACYPVAWYPVLV